MRLPIGIPIVVRNIEITGSKGSVWMDLIFDSGAAFTSLSWSVLKIIGYDPAIVPERQEIITANGVIEVPKDSDGKRKSENEANECYEFKIRGKGDEAY